MSGANQKLTDMCPGTKPVSSASSDAPAGKNQQHQVQPDMRSPRKKKKSPAKKSKSPHDDDDPTQPPGEAPGEEDGAGDGGDGGAGVGDEVSDKRRRVSHSSGEAGQDAGIVSIESIPQIGETFEVVEMIGSGAFSTVYKARYKDPRLRDKYVALKCIIQTSAPHRIEREIKCLHRLGGKNNVAELKGIVRHEDSVVLILEYFQHRNFKDYASQMTLDDIKMYMRGLFIALKYIHTKGIIHRDIKPTNFLHQEPDKFLLVDFGLADIIGETEGAVYASRPVKKSKGSTQARIHMAAPEAAPPPLSQRFAVKHGRDKASSSTAGSGGSSSVAGAVGGVRKVTFGVDGVLNKDTREKQQVNRAGTRGFRAPEVLLKIPQQSPSIDVWAAGIIFLTLLSGRFPFFLSNDDTDALAEIAACFGSEQVRVVAEKYGKEWLCGARRQPAPSAASASSSHMPASVTASSSAGKEFPPEVFLLDNARAVCERLRPQLVDMAVPDTAYDLLIRCLDLDPETRCTAEQALDHDFLKEQQ